MEKRLNKEEKQQKAIIDLINKMFEIAGHPITHADIKDRTDEWYTDWMMTVEQNKEWTDWGSKYLMKTFRTPKVLAEREMAMISLSYGLKFSNFNK